MYLAIGLITLFLTGFMLVYYAYLFRNTDHDVSFFISVGIIIMVMNLFTNAATVTTEVVDGAEVTSYGAQVLSVLYLIIDAVFIAVGWAVDVEGSKNFYTSIGPWCKATFTDVATVGWKVLSFVIAPAGVVLFFVHYKSNPVLAKTCGKAGGWGLLLWVIILWTILGII